MKQETISKWFVGLAWPGLTDKFNRMRGVWPSIISILYFYCGSFVECHWTAQNAAQLIVSSSTNNKYFYFSSSCNQDSLMFHSFWLRIDRDGKIIGELGMWHPLDSPRLAARIAESTRLMIIQQLWSKITPCLHKTNQNLAVYLK